MKKIEQIKPSLVSGSIIAPSSKSMMQRAVAASFLAQIEMKAGHLEINRGQNLRHSNILNPSDCEDALASLKIVEGLKAGSDLLDCGESGLSLRMFSPIVALFNKEISLTGRGSLLKRPVNMIETALKSLGVLCSTNNGFPPVKIKGPLKGGKLTVDGSITSQLITGLLMALPCCEKDSELTIKDLKSRPYVEMTLKLLSDFGIEIEQVSEDIFKIAGRQKYKAITCSVEGDWSGASFILVAGAIAARSGKVKIDNLNYNDSLQADKAIIDALKLAGANVLITNFTHGVDIHGEDTSCVEVSYRELKAFDFDATNCPDLFPPLVTLAVFCDGVSTIKGAKRLVHKESNRAEVLYQEFTKLGAKIEILDDLIKISGSPSGIKGGEIDSHNDHRIAMAGAIAGLYSKEGVKINGAECVSKSYPSFFEDLRSLHK